jgi:hypothetical protein
MRAHLAAACRVSVLVQAFRCPIICSSNRCASANSFICAPAFQRGSEIFAKPFAFNVLRPHHPEVMLSLLVIVLRFHRIAAQGGCLRKRHIYRVPGSLGPTELEADSQARNSRTAPVNKNTTAIVIAMADRSSVTPNARNPAMMLKVSIIATAIAASM